MRKSMLLLASLSLAAPLFGCSGAPHDVTAHADESAAVTASDGSKIRTKLAADGRLLEAAGVGKDGVKHQLLVLNDRETFPNLMGKELVNRDYTMARTSFLENGKPTLTLTSAMAPLSKVAVIRATVDNQEVTCAIDFSHAIAAGHGLMTRIVRIDGKRVDTVTKEWDLASKDAPLDCNFRGAFPDIDHRIEFFAPVLAPYAKTYQEDFANGGGGGFEILAQGGTTSTPTPGPGTALRIFTLDDVDPAHKKAITEKALLRGFEGAVIGIEGGPLGMAIGFLLGVDVTLIEELIERDEKADKPEASEDPTFDEPGEPGDEAGEETADNGDEGDDSGDNGPDGPGGEGDTGGEGDGDTGGGGCENALRLPKTAITSGIHILRMCEE